ncbi:MAG TPA: hypothetical protein VMU92_08610 [Acidobacteriaceae bacterium]|nr:hypothetical protein [Acidobacteriaceae bacterium]
MTKQLDLTSDQQSQIKPILEARHQQMQEAWKDKSLSKQDRREKMMEIQKDTSRKIKTVLNDTQKKKYEDMQMKMRDRMMHRNMHRGMGTGMGQGMMGQDSKPQPATSSQPPQ